MTTPPSSIPSPTPSSGSSQQKPQTFSSIAAYRPPPTGSSAQAPPSGQDSDDYSEGTQPQATAGNVQSSAAFLPQVSASPPPHTVPYVPPPQHAMAPDPIHSLSPVGGQPSVWGTGWRPGPAQGGPNGAAYPPGYGRGAPPNGHLTHQLPPNPLEAYGPSSRPSVSSTPGVVALPPPGGNNNGGSHSQRSASQPGEPRDRRRERTREEEPREREEDEVISTIFVVGFPDDMSVSDIPFGELTCLQEREFQNIFTFAPGFEAATLKFPSGSARREPAAAAALLAELQHLAATQGQQLGGSELSDQQQQQQQQQLDETFAALNFATQSSSASNTPSAAISLTPSAQTGATLGASNIPPSVPPRRQTIGFARFKTRADALTARDHLQGRRIDTLTGATLKAEMAKKNLHTKRGVAGDDLVGLLLRSGRLSQLVTQQSQTQTLPSGTPGGIPQSSQGGTLPGAPTAGAIQSAKEAWDAWPAPGQVGVPEPKANDMLNAPQAGGSSSHSNTSGSPPQSGKSPNARPTDSKALLALAEEADELEGWSVGSVGMGGMGFDYAGGGPPSGPRSSGGMSPGGPMSAASPLHSGSQHVGYGGGYGTGQQGPYNSALGFSQDNGLDPRSLGITANMNPADQNPPINTLYIGNLPAISPPTHPPNFLEESLRALFQRRPGFKRMSFRQKINGPMCFVEFEDIPYASQAMRELYGNTLNGLVKGGIRLSYSKNSLGQRGNSHQQAMGGSMFGGLAHTVALAGMSGAPQGAVGPGNGPGAYPMSGGSQPVPIGPPSGNQPGNSERRQGEASSLSPTAQPFNAPLPTSPRSQPFYGRDSERSGASSSNTNQSQATAAPPGGKQDNSFNSFSPPSVSQQGFSPVSSPIRTPASLGWVSSSGGGSNSNNAFGAFDAFGLPPHGLGSLNGAASAWGQSNSNPNPSS